LIKLYEKIGYEYNPERRRLGLAAATWLRIKERIINQRKSAARLAVALAQDGVSRTKIISSLTSENVNSRFVERSLYEGRRSDPRIPRNFQRFEEWFAENCQNDIIWDFVEEVHLIEYDGDVYDITVNHQAHNFIAEGFVVSNCGVRLMVTNLDEKDVRPRIVDLINVLFANIPSGLGSRRKDFSITMSDLDRIAVEGARYIVEKFGLGWHEDILHCEEEGAMEGADPRLVSPTAKSRGVGQIGTLGSGNHFLEVQRVDKIFDARAAEKMGITHEGQITVLIHTGSRGYGHQICGDYLRVMERASAKYGIKLPDRELACAPANSTEADQYLKAFKCAVNFAFANRQAITHWVRQSFEQVFKKSADALGMRLIYDVAHNIVKLEEHTIDKKTVKVWVHRKGATRSFPAGHPLIPKTYREIGQPVLIPGSMGTASWILLGNPKAMELTFGSTAHGAGREMSRAAAKRTRRATDIVNELRGRGIYIKADSMETIVEEADDAYKSVDKVAEVSHGVGIGTKVARLVPIGVIKG
jgi:tRNA-splicing ligase RtcB